LGRSQISAVIRYIENQEEYHRVRTFHEEYLDLLRLFEVGYDPRYVFKPIEGDEPGGGLVRS
jgi:hypothetical protein